MSTVVFKFNGLVPCHTSPHPDPSKLDQIPIPRHSRVDPLKVLIGYHPVRLSSTQDTSRSRKACSILAKHFVALWGRSLCPCLRLVRFLFSIEGRVLVGCCTRVQDEANYGFWIPSGTVCPCPRHEPAGSGHPIAATPSACSPEKSSIMTSTTHLNITSLPPSIAAVLLGVTMSSPLTSADFPMILRRSHRRADRTPLSWPLSILTPKLTNCSYHFSP